jgi:hypothetical protein
MTAALTTFALTASRAPSPRDADACALRAVAERFEG